MRADFLASTLCPLCIFSWYGNTKGALAHHSIAVFITPFFANF
jgi:hypothetical protein